MPEPTVTIRIWSATQEKLDAIARLSGVTNYARLLGTLVNAFATLTGDEQRQAYAASSEELPDGDGDGTSRQIRRSTYSKLEDFRRQTGWPFVRLVDVMTHAWQRLDYDRQRQAIQNSASPEADAA